MLRRIEIMDARWTRPAPPREVERHLRGARVKRLSRAGKYLVWELSGELYLLIHLRMTGSLLLDPAPEPSHTRARFELDSAQRLLYVDQRRFGTCLVLSGAHACEAHLSLRLGVEPLTAEFTVEHLRVIARGRRAPIKAFLLDQRRIAGVGNIYADEALFRARIHPLRPAGGLRRDDWSRLRDGIEEAIRSGIEAKGATIDDFRHLDGARGSFQDSFLVHRRAGEACPRCGERVRKIVVAGRGTYVCERCQRRPRVARPGAPALGG